METKCGILVLNAELCKPRPLMIPRIISDPYRKCNETRNLQTREP
jgi:hypothetical protein